MNWRHWLPPGLKLFLKRFFRPTPMQRVLAELQARGVCLGQLDALETFAYEGIWHTRDYAGRVGSLEVWEINPACAPKLRANLPRATIKITDSFEEIQKTPRKFNLVVVDNPLGFYGPDERYCEHFPLFPALFRVLRDEAVVILSVLPTASADFRARYPYVFSERYLAARRAFYQTSRPDCLPLEEMVAAYARHAAAHGFAVQWHFEQARLGSDVRYLALKFIRQASSAAA
jgi:hypothetical protein